jgi:hypothetical protein
MLDVAVAYNRFKFLGNEFLTWLWFIIENDSEYLKNIYPDLVSLEIGDRIVLENRNQEAVETITIKGDEANLEEGIVALRKGAVVTEINLHFKSGDQEWGFTIKGESLNISNLKIPFAGPTETAEEIENTVIEKIYLYDQVIQFVENLFKDFIKTRTSNPWQNKVIPMIRKWIYT